MNRPKIHVLIYADPGTGKSTFASTFPKPMLVWCFDSHGKDIPYWKGAKYSEVKQYQIGNVVISYRDITRDDGFIRVEYFHEHDINRPTAYQSFLTRLAVLHKEYDQWQTVVQDSATALELAARKLQEKVLNPQTPYEKGTDTRQWFAESTNALEEVLVVRFAGLPMNVVTICHQSQQMSELSGDVIRGPAVPGRLLSRNEMAMAYQEIYRMYVGRDDSGQARIVVQTRNRDGFLATTQLDAPDPCWPTYESLWGGWK